MLASYYLVFALKTTQPAPARLLPTLPETTAKEYTPPKRKEPKGTRPSGTRFG